MKYPNRDVKYPVRYVILEFRAEVLDQRKNLGNISLSSVQLLSHVQFFVTLWTVAHQAPPSMGFSRQEYWGELPFPSPGEEIFQSKLWEPAPNAGSITFLNSGFAEEFTLESGVG